MLPWHRPEGTCPCSIAIPIAPRAPFRGLTRTVGAYWKGTPAKDDGRFWLPLWGPRLVKSEDAAFAAGHPSI
jgi:hypothetical protein